MSDDHSENAKASDAGAAEPSIERETSPNAQSPDLEFHPIRIKGEPLSETIIAERRERPW
jgi:hypothetical protein